MTESMAAEDVPADQDHVQREHQRAHPDSKMAIEPESLDRVPGQEEPNDVGQPKEVPMKILGDQRQRLLTQVTVAGLAYRTGNGIRPESFVISAPIVIAGEAEESGN